MIRRETQYYIECDECGESTSSAFPRKMAMEEFRGYGFKIGKRHLCEDCSPNLKAPVDSHSVHNASKEVKE